MADNNKRLSTLAIALFFVAIIVMALAVAITIYTTYQNDVNRGRLGRLATGSTLSESL